MKKCFFFFFMPLLAMNISFSYASSVASPNTHHTEIEDLNEKIKDLEDERDMYRARAARAQNQGDRLQFENGMLTEARRYWIAADAYHEIADKIDEKITSLKKKRESLRKQYGLPPS